MMEKKHQSNLNDGFTTAYLLTTYVNDVKYLFINRFLKKEKRKILNKIKRPVFRCF